MVGPNLDPTLGKARVGAATTSIALCRILPAFRIETRAPGPIQSVFQSNIKRSSRPQF